MPTITQVRDAIHTTLSGVPGIGIVHKYERYANRPADLATLFKSAGQIRGWIIRRLSRRELAPAVGRYIVTHRWQIRGYMALDDSAASEIAFDDLLEAICDAFRADTTLGGVIKGTNPDQGDEEGIQVTDSGPVLFAGVLCHSARLALATWHSQ